MKNNVVPQEEDEIQLAEVIGTGSYLEEEEEKWDFTIIF